MVRVNDHIGLCTCENFGTSVQGGTGVQPSRTTGWLWILFGFIFLERYSSAPELLEPVL